MPHIGTILVPVDLTEASEPALAYALFLAARIGASVDVLHVAKVPGITLGIDSPPTSLASFAFADQHQRMSQLLDSARQAGVTLRGRLAVGVPETLICEIASDGGYDLIVMGTDGRTGIARLIMGSVAESVVRRAPCPVLTVHTPQVHVLPAAGEDHEFAQTPGLQPANSRDSGMGN